MLFHAGVIGATGYIGTPYRQELRGAPDAARITALCARRRDRLEAAASLKDLADLPGNRLEALKGGRVGQYGMRIDRQWRLCFEWRRQESGPTNVEVVGPADRQE